MGEVFGLYRMRVEVNAAHVDRPRQAGSVVDDGLPGRRSRRVLELGDVDVVGPLRRRALLEDGFLGDALDESLEDHRAVGHAAQRTVDHGQVVVDQVEFGDPDVGENDLVRVGDGYLLAAHVQRQGSGHTVMVISRPRCDARHILWGSCLS
jgi:hypothetical protein